MKRFPRRAGTIVVAVIVTTLLLAGCVSTGVENYQQFRGAVDAGASCDALYELKSGNDDAGDQSRIQRDLDDIGCHSPTSNRTDL